MGKRMANIKSAKKRIRTQDKQRIRNAKIKAHYKKAIKDFAAAEAESDAEKAEGIFRHAQKCIMKASANNVIHKNAAARNISRLEKRLNAIKQEK